MVSQVAAQDGASGWLQAMTVLIEGAHTVQPSMLATLVNEAVRPLQIDITVYLVDIGQHRLQSLAEPGKPARDPMPIEGTLGGRSFRLVQTLVAARRPGRLWLPLVDGTERLGVLDVMLPSWLEADDEDVQRRLKSLAGLVGHLVVAKTSYGDTLARARRSQPFTPAAEILTRLLPPLTFSTDKVTLSAIVEPCYTGAGDAFDYAVDDDIARLGIFDAIGHDLKATLTTAVALGATRTSRVQAEGLYAIARAVDKALVTEFSDSRFVTAVLADFDATTGHLRYINAGHPPPVLLREGQAVARLGLGRRLPLGLDDPTIEVADLTLQPGDRLLFYTDGFIEARNDDGEMFGLDRLVDVAERHVTQGLPAPETLRRLVHHLLDYHEHPLQDDATAMLMHWHP